MFLGFRKEKKQHFLSLQPRKHTKFQYNDQKTYQHDRIKRHHIGFLHFEARTKN